MSIDIDNLTEAELRDLNHRVVERLRFFAQMRAHSKMLQFKIGQRVQFDSDGGDAEMIVGVLTRYNKKTVTVLTDDGQRWNVSPALIRAVEQDRTQRDARPASHPTEILKLHDRRTGAG